MERGSVSEASAGDSLGLIHTIFERKYRVDRLVAEGGFGIVYKAHHLALAVPVALKILRPALRKEDDSFIDLMSQFLDEASVLSRLRRSSVAAVMDAGVSSIGGAPTALPWMALEWMDGETLRADLARRRGQGGRTPAQAMELLRPVLETIAEAHELQIVHRDLKPSNIMLVPSRTGVTARVLDFGIAKIMAPDGDAASNGDTGTASQRRAFTSASAAPEQLSGARTGPWTDVYALGLLLTEILSDRSPVATGDANERYRAAFARERRTPARAGVDVGSWEEILRRALAVRPLDRPRDARALLDQLEAALATTTDAVTANEAAAPTGRPRRRLLRAALALAALSAMTMAESDRSSAEPATRGAAIALSAPRPLVIVSEFRARGAAGAEERTRRLAATFAELLSEQLRIGDGVRIPDANTRVAMLQASGLDPRSPVVNAALLSRLRASTGAAVVVGGEVAEDHGALSASLEIYDGSRGQLLARISLSQPASDLNAFIREAGARIRRSLGRRRLSAEDEHALLSTLPESAEASMVYVEGLAALREFRYRDAEGRFEETHRLAPSFAPALAELATARLRLGERTRAQEAAEEAARLAASLRRGDELGVHAIAAETRNDWATAVDDYRALVRFYPDRVDYVTSLARAFVGVGKAPEAISLLESAKESRGSDWDRMRLDLLESFAYSRQSQDAASMDAAREAEQIAIRVGARAPLAAALYEQAYAHLRAGRLDAAGLFFDRARAVYVEVRDGGSVLNCDAGVAEIAQARGDVDRAIAIGEGLVAAHRASGNRYRLARETVSLGLVHASAGHLATARGLFEAGGRSYIEAHDREGEAYRLLNLGSIDLSLGRTHGVADELREGRAIMVEIKHGAGVAQADGDLARLAWSEGRLADADAAYEVAYAEGVSAKETTVLAAIALDRARFAFATRRAGEAARFADAERAVTACSELRPIALLDVLAAERALARNSRREALDLALSAEVHARKAHALDAIALALAALLDITDADRGARRAELGAMIGEIEPVEPLIKALLSLSRASTGADAVAFARRASEAATAQGNVVLAGAAQRQLARATGSSRR